MARRGGAFVYREADSFYHRLHPATKVIYTLMAMAIAFTIQHPLLLLGLLAIEIVLAVMARMSRVLVTVFLALVGTGALITFLTWLPFGADVGQTVYSQPLVFGLRLTLTDLGLLWAPAMGLRILASSLPLFVFLSATKPRDITIGLATIGMPDVAGTLFVMALRFVPMVQNDAVVIMEAQRARGLDLAEGTARERTHKYSAILAPLVFMSLRRIQLVANSLDTKGFRNKLAHHRFYHQPRLRAVDWALSGICIGAWALALFARTQGWGIIISTRL